MAIVGTRSPTTYGREAAAVLSCGLAETGLTVVSGLALGIDGIAHRTALESGGRTIAVLAGDLRRSTGLPITAVSSTLTMLELKGKIKQVGCMHHIRIREAAAAYDN